MTDPECRWCHRPVFWNILRHETFPWDLVRIEYERTWLCDARDFDEGHDPEVTHMCPPSGELVTPCCNKTPFELPTTDHLTLMPEMVNCGLLPTKRTEWDVTLITSTCASGNCGECKGLCDHSCHWEDLRKSEDPGS